MDTLIQWFPNFFFLFLSHINKHTRSHSWQIILLHKRRISTFLHGCKIPSLNILNCCAVFLASEKPSNPQIVFHVSPVPTQPFMFIRRRRSERPLIQHHAFPGVWPTFSIYLSSVNIKARGMHRSTTSVSGPLLTLLSSQTRPVHISSFHQSDYRLTFVCGLLTQCHRNLCPHGVLLTDFKFGL